MHVTFKMTNTFFAAAPRGNSSYRTKSGSRLLDFATYSPLLGVLFPKKEKRKKAFQHLFKMKKKARESEILSTLKISLEVLS